MVAAVGLQRVAYDAAAEIRDAPPACARDFGQQTQNVQALEQAAHRRTMTVAIGVAGPFVVQGRAKVLVPEALCDVIPGQDRRKQRASSARAGLKLA
jgi:hypothetical protein